MLFPGGWNALVEIAAAALCVAGGLILLSFQSADTASWSLLGHNAFETIGHGVGLYCAGRGVWMLRDFRLSR